MAIIASTTASVEPVVITVPELSGKFITLSAVALTVLIIVSNASAAEPSKIKPPVAFDV